MSTAAGDARHLRVSVSRDLNAPDARRERKSPELVVPAQTLDVIKEDPSDNRILECEIEAGSEYIVSGDKDLQRLGQYGAIRVIKAADMLDLIHGKEWRSRGHLPP